MLLTRWKLMAGVLGVSIGGLAAAASQCPKLDKTKGRQPEAPVTAEAPKLPPAGAPSAPKPLELPAPPSAPSLPDLTPPAAAPALGLPSVPTALPSVGAPPVEVKTDVHAPPYLPGAKPAAKPEEPKAAPALPSLPLPDAKPALEPSKTTTPAPAAPPMNPPKPVAEAPKIVPVNDLFPSPATTGAAAPGKPTATPPVMPASGTAQPTSGTVLPLGTGSPAQPPAAAPIETPKIVPTPIEQEKPVLDVPSSKPTPAPAAGAGAVKVEAMKYRIVLRVGEGEPTFEVKSGDDLVLKVACEKVDIKSPEKGAGLSAVTARGKVRFAGFGVEGTCEELSFMAGTGEVVMNGDVKVQMKDKLGRVESELTTATLKYKIDANAVGASIKP